MRTKLICDISIILFSVCSIWADTAHAKTPDRVYEASLRQSHWESGPSSRLHCQLRHPIPFYGTATFDQEAGAQMRFQLHVMGPQVQAGTATSWILPSDWKLGKTVANWDSFPVQASKKPFRLNEVQSQQLLIFLKTGRVPAFDFQDVAGPLRIVLSAVGFQQAYWDYSQCLEKLLTFSFRDIATRTVYFSKDSSELPPEAEELLQQIALYHSVDSGIRLAHLVGYSDNQAKRRQSYLVSLARVETVQQFLIQQGFPAQKILVDAFGERDPVASNDTPEGQAKNRRVTIRLER